MPGKPTFTPCWFTEKIEGGKMVSTNEDRPTCLTTAQATALQKGLRLG